MDGFGGAALGAAGLVGAGLVVAGSAYVLGKGIEAIGNQANKVYPKKKRRLRG